MKRWAALLLAAGIWGAGAGTLHAAEDAFARGAKLYEEGKYKNAAQEFEKFLDNERSSAAGLYNLGNCYFKLGERGKAVWAYEKALLLDPRDEDLRWNLELLRKQLTDKQGASGGLRNWIARKTERLGADEIAWAFSAAVGIFSLWILAAALVPFVRPAVSRTMLPVLVLIAITGAAAGVRWAELRYPAAVVTDREVYVRYGPSKEATRAFLLHEGAKVRILKESSGWLSVEFGMGEKGWLERETVLRVR